MMKMRTNNLILLLLPLCLPFTLKAQDNGEEKQWYDRLGEWVSATPWEYEEPLPVTHTKVLLQFGDQGIIDEYLSPISHNGWQMTTTAITDYALRAGRHWHLYQEVMLTMGINKNGANGTKMEVIRGEYSLGPSWRVLRKGDFTLDLAPLFNLQLQGNRKSSNFNNYGNGKGSFGLDGWARLRYRIPWKVSKIALSYSMQMSFLHGTFHPDYGQSYYEYVSGENRSPFKFHVTSLHNDVTFRQRLLVDIPIHHLTLTMGAEHFYQKQRLSQTRFIQGYWGIVFGISFDSFYISGGRSASPSSISSSLY